jgi:hypothetical protein
MMKNKLLKGLLGLLLTLPFQPSFALPLEEQEALATLFGHKLDTSATGCEPRYIDCSLNNEHVIRIHPYRNDITGSLPPEIGVFSHLVELDLNDSHLTSLPPEIGQLSHLKKLDLSGTHLTSIPPEIGKLSHIII